MDKKKKKVSSDDKPKTSKPPKSGSDKGSQSSVSKTSKSASDVGIDELDQKWSDRFNRLETLLLVRTLDKSDPEPTFQPVKVTPMHIPPVGSVKATKPFMKPTDRPHLATDQPAPSDLSGTDPSAKHRQVTSKTSTRWRHYISL